MTLVILPTIFQKVRLHKLNNGRKKFSGKKKIFSISALA